MRGYGGTGRRDGVASSWPAGSLLGRLPDPVRAAMLALGAEKRWPAGQAIIRLGEPSTHAYLILGGFVKVHGNDSGHEPLLAIRTAGDLVGEMGVLSGGGRSATVTTCSATAARVIGAEELRGFLRRMPGAAFELACRLSERLRWANERRVDFAATDAASRVCRTLLALLEMYGRAGVGGTELAVAVTQAEVASLAGVGLATTEKALRGLVGDGVVRWGYRRVVVSDPAALRRLADLGNDPHT
jgi:CRP-like cAMP-binding protein